MHQANYQRTSADKNEEEYSGQARQSRGSEADQKRWDDGPSRDNRPSRKAFELDHADDYRKEQPEDHSTSVRKRDRKAEEKSVRNFRDSESDRHGNRDNHRHGERDHNDRHGRERHGGQRDHRDGDRGSHRDSRD